MDPTELKKQSMRPFISVVMPVYNRAEFVAEAIESVLNQTYDHWELILVDDGSTDGSYDVELEYERRYPERIRCVTHQNRENRGISASRNRGNAEAKGDYIACLDSDDMWVPEKLARQVDILRAHPEVGMIVGATKYWHPGEPRLDLDVLAGGPRDRLIQPPELFYAMYPMGEGCAPSMNTVLLRKDLIERTGGWEEKFRTTYEDQVILTKVYLMAPVYISTQIGDIYRQHANSVVRKELAGTRYFRKRYEFLTWLEHWMKNEQPERKAELQLVQQAKNDRALWAYRDPVRYNAWRVLIKLGHALNKVTRWSERS